MYTFFTNGLTKTPEGEREREGGERERDREFGVQPTMPDRFMPEQSWLFGDEALYGLAAPQMQFF